MDERDRKIQQLERQIEKIQQEADKQKRGAQQFRYDWHERDCPEQGMASVRYNRRPEPPPKVRPLRIVLIVAGSLGALAIAMTVILFLAFTLMDTVDKESTALAEEMLWAIVEQDTDRGYALTYPDALTRDEFGQDFGEMCAIWQAGGGGDSFELKRTRWSMNSSGGVTEYFSIYEVASGEARFTFRLTRLAHGETTGMTKAQLRR